MNEHLAKRLFDAHRAAVKIATITDGLDLAAYLADEVTRLAVERLLEIAGEAIGVSLRMEPDLEVRFPNFRRAVGLRNRIIHGYDDINDVVMWDIVQTNIPLLKSELETLLNEILDGENLRGDGGPSK